MGIIRQSIKIFITVVAVVLQFSGRTVYAKQIQYSATKTRVDVIYGGESIASIPKNNVVEVAKWGSKYTEITYDTGRAKVLTSKLMNTDEFKVFLDKNPSKVLKTTDVKFNNVRVRSKQNQSSPVIAVVGKQSDIEFIASKGSYSKVRLDGKEGYVHNSSLKVTYTVKVPSYINDSILRDRIVDYAMQFKGNKYVWGGTSLETGADCSGFVRAVLANHGIWVPRVSIDQSGYGKEVSLENIRKGDLIFYMRDGQIGHVGMYIGNGKIIQALNSRVGTIVSDMYFATPIKAMSVIGD